MRKANNRQGDGGSFISNSSRTFTDPLTGNKTAFAARYRVSTNDYFNANAEEIVRIVI